MMGPAAGEQDSLFYEFSLGDVVPADHLLRKIDSVLDLSWLRSELRPHYSHMGRPSVCPELMIRMLLLGYCYSIRSERRLCQEVELNLAYRWFCRLGLEDRVPDHSTFSHNRHGRFRVSDVLRKVFEEVVSACMKAGLVGGEGFAVDASVIEADASRFQRVEGAFVDWSAEELGRRPVAEYMLALASENPTTNPERPAKAMSPVDPSAAWTTRGRHKVMFAYSLNYLIDLEEAVIVDVEATPTRITKEIDAAESMLERVEERFALKPERIAADVAYGTGEMLNALIERQIEPHIPVFEGPRRNTGRLSREAFAYDTVRDVYVCPQGHEMKTNGRVHDGTRLHYRARTHDCRHCPLKPRCCPRDLHRRIDRDINEAARDYTRALMATEAYAESQCERKKVETLFGEIKRTLGLDRLRLRGLSGARDEFLLAATIQNLKRLIRRVAIPPPAHAFAA